jgi:hypothetical protein
MKYYIVLCTVLITALISMPVLAQCPNPGTYTTSNGTILPGRASEAWCGNMGPGVPGNMENAMSWDGSFLGSQWHVWGMAIAEPGAMEQDRDVDEFGNGWIDYLTYYTGGQFWLSGSHSWGSGTDMAGMITYFKVTTTVNLVLGEVVGATSNIFLTGIFDDCPNCELEYVISNALLEWRSGWPDPMPENYPDFLCEATMGELFSVCCIRATIRCGVGAEQSTWGAIKELLE